MSSNLQLLNEKIDQCEDQYNRILLIVGKFGSGKTKLLQAISKSYNYPYINLNLALSERLLNLSNIERSLLDLDEIMSDIVNKNTSEVILIDNIEIVFNPELKRDPLQLFRHISRNKTIIVSWPGRYEKQKLSYAEPYHPEYFEEKVTDLTIHSLSEQEGR
jgi:predicted ATP-binding protein involved in virulence